MRALCVPHAILCQQSESFMPPSIFPSSSSSASPLPPPEAEGRAFWDQQLFIPTLPLSRRTTDSNSPVFLPHMEGVRVHKQSTQRGSKPPGRTLMAKVFAWMYGDATEAHRVVHSCILDFSFFSIRMPHHSEEFTHSASEIRHHLSKKTPAFLHTCWERSSTGLSDLVPFSLLHILPTPQRLPGEEHSLAAPLRGDLECCSFFLHGCQDSPRGLCSLHLQALAHIVTPFGLPASCFLGPWPPPSLRLL